jgi:hypothetical protein
MKVFFVFFSFINHRFARIKKYEKIMKNVFYKDDGVYQDNFNVTSKIMNNFMNVSDDKTGTKIIGNNDLFVVLSRKMNAKNKKLDFDLSFYDKVKIICKCLCKKRFSNKFVRKFEFFNVAREKVRGYFNYINVIKRFEEVEQIKYILFSPIQNFLLKLNKSKIDNNINESKIITQADIDNKVKEYVDIINRNDTDVNSQKILNLLLNNDNI